ncbi:MAG: Crp/Fnr family transcriptional regulator [Aggregatilineales bacterium]
MLNQNQLSQLLHVMPRLRNADARIVREFQQHAFLAHIPAGKDVFALGDHVDAIALLISGSVRVYKIGNTGREITLYRFSAGESCILTASAILNHELFSANATVETDAEAVMIPSDIFQDWVDRFSLWRKFVFELLSQRLSSVIEIVDEVAFGRLDQRVATFLLERHQQHTPIHVTHQEIADELGSSREVISRILGNFASQMLIQIGRGTIEILDPDTLSNYILN